MQLRNLVLGATLAVAGLAFAAPAKAVMINGSMTFSTGGVILVNGSNLANTTQFRFQNPALVLNTMNSGATTGDYTSVPVGTVYTTSLLDLNNLTAFSATSTRGTFGAPYGSPTQVLQQTANFLDVILVGTYSGLGAGFDPTLTSLRISLNQSGGSVGATITLASPPVTPAPEPTTYVAALMGAGALVALRRRVRRTA